MTIRHLLVTRPRDDAVSFAAAVRALGIEPTIEPLFEIHPLESASLDLAGVQAVLLTSQNGVRAFAAKTGRRDLRIFAVGDASAAEARKVGFTDVQSAAGDADALAAKAIAELDPARGALLHVAGTTVAGNLVGTLTDAGFVARRAVLYDAQTVPRLSPDCRVALAQHRMDAVAFFSPRSAAAFVRLARAEALAEACTAMTAFCLSPATAGAAEPLGWRQVFVAVRPDQAALLQLLRNEAHVP